MANSEIPCRYIAGNHDWHFEGSGPDIPQPELRRRWIKKLAPLYVRGGNLGFSCGNPNFCAATDRNAQNAKTPPQTAASTCGVFCRFETRETLRQARRKTAWRVRS